MRREIRKVVAHGELDCVLVVRVPQRVRTVSRPVGKGVDLIEREIRHAPENISGEDPRCRF